MDYQILQGIRLRIQPVHHDLSQLLISTCQAEEGQLKTYPAQASTFLSAMKTDKNVPQILDVDGDTTGSPTATSYTQRRNPKGIPKIGPDLTPKMMISIWERYMASWLTISIPTAYSRQ